MRNLLRPILAIAIGIVAWFAVATAGNLAIRWLIPGYAEVERTMDFSLSMLLARLVLGAVSSIAAGAACAAIATTTRRPVHILALMLLVLFVPVHVSLWNKFPIWYHALFLLSLAPLVMLGARLSSSRGAIAAYDLGKWYGGIRLPPEKEQSTSEAVREMPIPEQVVLPLAQHSGDPAQPVVDVGDRVLKGQLNLAMSATPDPRG